MRLMALALASAVTMVGGGASAVAGTGSTPITRPIRGIAPVPRNRYMAPNGRSEIHNDASQSDAYTWSGPLGRTPVTISAQLGHDCGSVAFDSHGRIVSVCVGIGGPELYMLDAGT